MKYAIGTPIPDEDILRCFKDEDDDIFIEVRGMPEALFRVTEGNRVYYKIDKDKMQNEELILLEDNSWAKPKTQHIQEPVPTAPLNAEPTESPFDSLEFTAESTTTSYGVKKSEEKPGPSGFPEGQQLPDLLKPFCKPNGYGGYSLRYEKFLYMLDRNYRIEIKTPDSFAGFNFDQGPVEPGPKSVEPSMIPDKDIELDRGDTLPANLRRQCEAEIGPGAGSRITIGDYLYILNAQYKVTQKMKISYFDDDEDSGKTQETGPVPAIKEQPAAPEKLSAGDIVDNLIKSFGILLDQYNISADFFKESVLSSSNRENLIRAYDGNLSELNDDTREASLRGEKTVLKEKGYSLFKAVLIHEIYIKTTLAGRGDKMEYFLTHIVAAKPDGSIAPLQDNLPQEEQKKMIDLFGERADFYPDKTDVIKRVYRQIRKTILEEYKEIEYEHEDVRLNALLIAKLYENTNRLDRGSGVTMIRLCRDIIDYKTYFLERK
jgi:hypothetical protein